MRTIFEQSTIMAVAIMAIMLPLQQSVAAPSAKGEPRGCIIRDIREQAERCLQGYQRSPLNGIRDQSPIKFTSMRLMRSIPNIR